MLFSALPQWEHLQMKIKNLRIISRSRSVHGSENRWFPKVAVILGLSLFGVVAAFGIAPGTSTATVPTTPIIAELKLPDFGETSNENLPYSHQGKVQRGDTVAGLLARLNIDDPAALEFLKSDPVGQAISQLKPGKTVQAITTETGDLLSLHYFNQWDSVLVVERSADGFVAKEQAFSEAPRLVFKTGTIRNSLFGATDAAGVPDAVATQLAKIFSTDIDFHTDLRRGDQFSVAYEVYYQAGEPVRTGRVLAAEFVNDNRPYRALFFESKPDQGEYYTPEGKNLREAFLRSPLEFSRVSSGFTMARFHPVLKNWRAHTGVDFAAPAGTRVQATADGVVSFAGQQNGYGNVVEIKHQSQYSTLYAHLSGFASGLRLGMNIRQGEIVGYVGATGFATGPHLHYEFKVAGAYRDPLGVAVPLAIPLQTQQLAAFHRTADALQSQLALLRGSDLASFE